jgi:DNA-binding NtrC family response regulator
VGEALSLALSLRDIRPLVALTPEQWPGAAATERVDVVIQDMNFTADTTSGRGGRRAVPRDPRPPHRRAGDLLTAWTHLEAAVELVKAGAADYLAKPWDDIKLLATVENLLELAESTRRGAPAPRRAPQARKEAAGRATSWTASCSPPKP